MSQLIPINSPVRVLAAALIEAQDNCTRAFRKTQTNASAPMNERVADTIAYSDALRALGYADAALTAAREQVAA